MSIPPIARGHRRSRNDALYESIARWHESGLGLDLGERWHLEALGYGKSLARRRLTDTMTVALIDYRLAALEDDVVNVAPTWSERVARIAEALAQRQVRPSALTAEEAVCLSELRDLQAESERLGGDRLSGYTADGRAIYERSPDSVLNTYTAIRERFPRLMRQIEDQVRERIDSTDMIKLSRYAPPICLGQRSSAVEKLRAFRAALGKRYLDPNASTAYRRACVRKWKQSALARAARDEQAHRAMLEHNRQVRERHRDDRERPAKLGAFLIV